MPAGTTLPLDLSSLAEELGFDSAPVNSYDSVGDRDFILGALDVFSAIALHLSRISEDVIYWASTPVALVKLPVNLSTGSSIMPNKRNPDVPELIRAKAAHVMGSHVNALLLLKGLPSSYSSDLHELKSVLLRSFSEIKKCLSIFTPFISELGLNTTSTLLEKGHLLATEIANHLTIQGVPFREAYAQTAALVECAESQNIAVEKLKVDLVVKIAPLLDLKWLSELSFEKAVEARNQSGGTSLKTVLSGIDQLEDKNSK